MPLVKQGKFAEYYNNSESIVEKFKLCHNNNFDEWGNFIVDLDPFSNYFYEVDYIYKDAVELLSKLKSLLEVSETKTKNSVKRCNECIYAIELVISNCIQDFRTVYDLYQGDFTLLEQDSFQNYDIYKEI